MAAVLMGWLDGGRGICKVKPEAKDDEVVGAPVPAWVVAECLHVAVSQAPPDPTKAALVRSARARGDKCSAAVVTGQGAAPLGCRVPHGK